MHNTITDVAGVMIGNADDPVLMSGVTAIVFDTPSVAAVSVPGPASAGRDLACLDPAGIVPVVDAIVISGGSGFGLEAASGVQAWLREQRRGFKVGNQLLPIVPGAICFDLTNGGDKDWGRFAPYRELGYAAAATAATGQIGLGTAGAGFGASTVDLKGGLGSTSATTSAGFTVGAIVAVNALGSTLAGHGPHFLAGPFERDGEFGGLGAAQGAGAGTTLDWKGRGAAGAPATPPSTTLACVATDARLDKPAATRLARAASAGLARGLRLAHAAMDGDTVFAAATARHAVQPSLQDEIEICGIAADCLARAIARAVFLARVPPAAGRAAWAGPPSWADRFG